MYDYLIIGSGLFGSICARELTNSGFKCLVIDKRNHIGGNCYTENIEGINVHKYGAHIFHTSDDGVWNYMNKYTKFNHFVNRPKVNFKNEIYSFPINLMTLYQIYKVTTPEQAKLILNNVKSDIPTPKNLEEWVLSQVGKEIYEIFIKGYTTKQWGRDPKELPSSIIKRLPIRLNYDDNYFFDKYQGIPIGGYTEIFKKLLDGIDIMMEIDYFKDREKWNGLGKKIIYTGPIDKFYDYKFGFLEYKTTKFEHKLLNVENYQGTSVMNFTDIETEFTRIIEHKHFEKNNTENTWVTWEYPVNYEPEKSEPMYPVNDSENNSKYSKYKELESTEKNIIFGGRLAEYKYYDMHQVIESALSTIKKMTNG